MLEIIHKNFQIAKAFVYEHFEFVLGRRNQTFIIQFMLMLLLVETDTILK